MNLDKKFCIFMPDGEKSEVGPFELVDFTYGVDHFQDEFGDCTPLIKETISVIDALIHPPSSGDSKIFLRREVVEAILHWRSGDRKPCYLVNRYNVHDFDFSYEVMVTRQSRVQSGLIDEDTMMFHLLSDEVFDFDYMLISESEEVRRLEQLLLAYLR